LTTAGTPVGTSPLAQWPPGPEGSLVREIAVGATRAYLLVQAGGVDTLWVTNGKPGGTSKFFEVSAQAFAPGELTTLGDELYFRMATPGEGAEPWTSDGTAAGTRLVLDAEPGAAGSQPAAFTAAQDRVFFATEWPLGSFQHQRLWITNGSAAGTSLVAELPSPPGGAAIASLWHAGADRRVLFSSVDANGSEWWVSDGTAGGTLPLTDSAPGPKFADPTPGVLLGNRLLFAAADGQTGTELHALPLAATGAWAATKLGQGCAGASGTPELLFAGGAVEVGASLLLALAHAPPSGVAVWAFDGSYGALPPFGACALQLPAPKLLAATAVSAAGESSLPAAVPALPSLVGGQVDVQALALAPGGPFAGLGALSDVLELVVGP
jgi:ELWxxDGT repeat protein